MEVSQNLYYAKTSTRPSDNTALTVDQEKHTVCGLDRWTQYFFWVCAGNANGEACTPGATAKTLADPPTAPDMTCTARASGTQIDCNWTPPADDGGAPITKYCLYMAQDENMPADPAECYGAGIANKAWNQL